MEYEDRVTIPTPEGVQLDLTLAGLGSRFIAASIDWIIRIVLLVALGFLLAGGSAAAGGELGLGVGAAVFFVLAFLLIFAYDVLFEVLASGRTPGKRVAGIRVVLADGRPVTFIPSVVRNVLRLVDFLPGSYLAGAIAILATPRNQRFGDLAGGTLVVRDRIAAVPAWTPPPTAPPEVPAWDVSAITADELVAVRSFLERRHELEPEARRRLGLELAERLRPKVAGAPEALAGEGFLERLAAAKAARG